MAAKRKQNEEESKTHWRTLGGFDAFDPHASSPQKRKMKRRWANGSIKTKKPKLVKCEELPEPEVGIHSLAWAQAIAPQASGFLKLPIEVRNRIYEHVIGDWTCGYGKGGSITPWKKARKFHDNEWRDAPKETAGLYLLCRQVYVDVVGSGLLYAFRKFHFTSPPTMLNYLWVINPRHKDAIRTIQLDMNLSMYLQCFDDNPPPKCGRPFEMIATCRNLQHFVLNLRMTRSQYSTQWEGSYWTIRAAKSISVNENFLQLILNCAALRDIRGLKSFEILFTPDWFSRTVPPFTEKNQIRLIEVIEEIRGLVTKDAE
ncbi:hypothetical protein N431DRAFT_539121 [Stipitochalara longipes BDJ]|nr:hypothetical protein N431DRAFT_539121 [Stipitochalara longipes BDJ]